MRHKPNIFFSRGGILTSFLWWNWRIVRRRCLAWGSRHLNPNGTQAMYTYVTHLWKYLTDRPWVGGSQLTFSWAKHLNIVMMDWSYLSPMFSMYWRKPINQHLTPLLRLVTSFTYSRWQLNPYTTSIKLGFEGSTAVEAGTLEAFTILSSGSCWNGSESWFLFCFRF